MTHGGNVNQAAESLSATDTPEVTVKGIRGFGYPYLRGKTWWVRYYHNGQDFRESSKSPRLVDAERLLKARWKQIGRSRGKFIGPKEEKVRVNDLLDAVVTDYEVNGRRSLDSLLDRLKPLRDAFGSMRAVDVTGAMVEEYKAARLATKTARRGTLLTVATVNRELAALNRAFRLGVKQDRLTHAPVITLMAEHNARQGFVEPATFEKIVKYLPDPLDDLARFAFLSGWRKGEILSLEWSDVDLAARRVWLRREHSKNQEPRVLVLTGDLLALIERRWLRQEYPTASGTPALSRWVFHRRGQPVKHFLDSWRAACLNAGVPGLLFHDLRRSAVRNMTLAGVDPIHAMKVTGHKTASIYRRYQITDERDIERALVKTQEAIRRQTEERPE